MVRRIAQPQEPRRIITREVHGPIPWAQVASCANVWLLSGAIITMTAMYELMNSWYPTYLQQARGASPDLSGRLTTLVLVPWGGRRRFSVAG